MITAKLKRRARTITGFFVGQGALQTLNAFTNFLLLHLLSVEAYAQFGLAFGFQLTADALTNFGFASTIIPLVGDRAKDGVLVGTYVRAAKRLRNVSFLIIAPFCAIAFLFVVHDRHWSMLVQLGLLASILLSIYSSGPVSYFSAPLFLNGRLKQFYIPQTLASAARLLCCGLIYLVGWMYSWTAALVTALGITLSAYLLAKQSRKLIVWPEQESKEAEREIVKTILPTAPAIIFSAFQSQLSLLLIAFFGKTVAVAQVAALSRLAQLFAVLATFNTVVLEPYVAKQASKGLAPVYIKIITFSLVCCIPFIGIAFLYPDIFLWLLGAKYEALRNSVGWYVTASFIGYIASVIWIMNRSRKWLFWRGAWAEVVLIISAQVIFIWKFGMDSTQKAVFFVLVTSCARLLAHAYIALYGFSQRQDTVLIAQTS